MRAAFRNLPFYLLMLAISITGLGEGFMAATNVILYAFFSLVMFNLLLRNRCRRVFNVVFFVGTYTVVVMLSCLINSSFGLNFFSVVRGIAVLSFLAFLGIERGQIEEIFLRFGIINSILGIIQEMFFVFWGVLLLGENAGKDFIFLGDKMLLRVEGLVGDSNLFAACLVIPLILSFSRYTKSRKIKYLVCFLLMFSCMFLTGSRAGILGGVLGVAMLLLRGRGNWARRLGWSVVAVLALIFVFKIRSGGRSDSLRMFLLLKAIDLWRDNPFWGVGLGKFGYYNGNATAHNVILESLSETGVIATTILVVGVLGCLICQFRRSKDTDLWISCVAFLATSLFLSLLTNLMFWCVVGLILFTCESKLSSYFYRGPGIKGGLGFK